VNFGNPGEFSISATFGLEINNIALPVDQTFAVNGTNIHLNMPAGPYLRVTAYNADVTIVGIHLRGDFLFDQGQRAGPQVKRATLLSQ